MGAAQRVEATGVRPWVRAALRCGAMLAVAALALPLAGTAYAAPEPRPNVNVAPGADPLADAKATLAPLLQRLHQLYTEAEAATEQYNTTADKLRQQQATVADLHTRLARQQTAVDTGTDIAAQLAGAQYRNGNVSEYADLLLAKDPYEAVVIAELLQAAGRSQSVFLDKLKADRAELTGLQQQAEAAQAQVQALATQQERTKTDTAKRLQAVEDMVASLTGAQRSELEQLEKQQADEAQLAFLASGALGKGERTPSAAGRQAVAYALAQLGKDYRWGGEGPDMFDCSGLTSQAWLHAGRPIPRTSQEQWAGLRHVALNQLRPGDLVIYHEDATHVGMYIGGGLVVQAPHTGAVVKISPVAMLPILGAVRPDPEAGADEQGGAWKVPDVGDTVNEVTPIKPSKPSELPKPPAPPETHPPTGTPSSPPPSTPPSTPPSAPSSTKPGTPSATPSGSGSPSPSASLSPSGSPSTSGRG
ncbi:NlpC/P60 family protein [Kitasatospora sp. GP82]|uniref:C40 family peptidase n=1 Tax=Kitasatospora sp. GP82 TaxID=3035089 RepID=UPI002474B9BC|nr:NlpC/P60 family protein [Kitasatospora sp. GP82]MDH6123366.1 cell wall-associated NlpC family hydrolase [Kitasatospora sp. GP82]